MKIRKIYAWLILLGFVLLEACGSDNGSLRVVTNGIVRETQTQEISCIAGGPAGSAIAGSDGYMAAPLVCSISFRTDGLFADFLQITVFDVPAAHEYLGAWMPVGGGLLDAYVTLQGQVQYIGRGTVRFAEISNVIGRRVCAQYLFDTGLAVVEGEFCDQVQVSY